MTDSVKDAIGELSQYILVDAPESVVEQCDKDKAIALFQETVGEGDVAFNQIVEFLRNTVPIERADKHFYEECVRLSNNDLSDALDLVYKVLEKMRDNHRLEQKARQQEDELLKMIEEQEIEAKKRSERAKERERLLEELKIKNKRIFERISAMSVPEYLKGRLPTDLCKFEVTVKDTNISFNWRIKDGVELSPKDWIGLYIHDRQYSNKYENFVSLGGKKEGSSSFTAPGIGYFDLRYYQNNGSEEKSRSEPFLVGPEMMVDAELQGRRKIIVSWNRSCEKEGDWLGLYPVSTYSNAQYIQQIPASNANSDGKVMFDAPRQPGEYEVRYFFTSKKHGTGYAFSGVSEHIVIPNEDKMEVIATHPIVKVQWQTFSQVPNNSDWIGLYESSDSKAKRLGWEYTGKKGLMDSVGDHGIAEIEVDCLMRLSADTTLPEGSEKWEVRLFNKAPNQPFLRAPFVKPQ